MNDQQFSERAHANPYDDSPDFLEAASGSPERLQLLEELKKLDNDIREKLESVSGSDELKQSLLAIPEGTLQPDTYAAAANDSFWRRNAKYAAGLVIAVGVLAVVVQDKANPLEDMVFRHIYSELEFLDSDTPVTLADVNNMMTSWVGSSFEDSADMQTMTFNFTKECWVDFQAGVHGLHAVMKGNVGPVTVMVIPNSPVNDEMSISDDRFEGVISPTAGGNLVVVGEKQEPIRQYSNMLAANIVW